MLKKDCEQIVHAAISAVQPTAAVYRALEGRTFGEGRLILVAVGKAAWTMADAATKILPHFDAGAVITKYDHAKGDIEGLSIFEAGHPEPDAAGFAATQRVLEMTAGLSKEDTVLLLLSGGGSALFEKPLVSKEEFREINRLLLRSGANIYEINTVRKHLSSVKGGRFAGHCAPAKVLCLALSDVLGDDPSVIASGPACVDRTSGEEALEILRRYAIPCSATARECLLRESVKELPNAEVSICGSVCELTAAVKRACEKLGYESVVVTNELTDEARDAGEKIAALAREKQGTEKSLAFIFGGETVVHVQGEGIGGRNQELSLAAARGIEGLLDTAVFSFGSDGTDGPTDAAGGFADGETAGLAKEKGIDLLKVLDENDSYHALESLGSLIITGPTGTNVNDAAVLLIKR